MIRAALVSLLLSATAASACARGEDPCAVDLGTYRVAVPDGAAPAGGRSAILFLHGFGGSGNGTLGMSGTVRAITDRGYAVLAPDGLPRTEGGPRSWAFLPPDQRPAARDEGAFFDQVVTDAADRHGVDPGRVMLAGFSAGGFMVSYLACADPSAFPAYAPVAGGFWRPHPASCAGPVKLLHTHGFRDSTVPLEGRPLRDGEWLQGDIFEGLAIWRAANGCAWPDPSGYARDDTYQRRRWDCGDGAALEFALHDGGHGIPPGWADMALDWFEMVVPD
ncbi:alpha/beta hydrolase family esterase [Jannaschia sp. LMIT008]|uniref:alpha/beta hydrolase family esterase n=1 Tax=Jannaschia maritima TaxID=3032585 RepID=UPI0028128EAC|nr:PHB depolymerase family esterase [Jannaschia sp. LMIT008]